MTKPVNINNIKVLAWRTYTKKKLDDNIESYVWGTNKISRKDFEDFKKHIIDNRTLGLKGLTFYKLKYPNGNFSLIATFK